MIKLVVAKRPHLVSPRKVKQGYLGQRVVEQKMSANDWGEEGPLRSSLAVLRWILSDLVV